MGAYTRCITAATIGTKASSLATDRVDRAAWCRPSPRTRGLGINHLGNPSNFSGLPQGTFLNTGAGQVAAARVGGLTGQNANAAGGRVWCRQLPASAA
jgi:hypothetical protein